MIYIMDHPNNDLKHYHLQVKYGARVHEITEVFRHSNKRRDIDTATVAEIKNKVQSKVDEVKNNIFYLTWKGKKLEPDTLKIRDIKVDGERLPLYTMKEDPIEIHIGNGDDVPSIDPSYASDSDDEKSDLIPDFIHKRKQKEEENQKEEEKQKKQKEEENQKKQNKTTIHELRMKATVAETGAENLKRRGIIAEKNGLFEKATELLEKAKSLSEEAKRYLEQANRLSEGKGKKSKKSKKRFIKKRKHKTKSK